MNSLPSTSAEAEPPWLTGLVRAEPRAPLMFPYLAYLLVLALQEFVPPSGWPIFIGVHMLLIAGVCWTFRRHYPPLGRPYLIVAIPLGLVTCVWWVAGQHWADHASLFGFPIGGRMPLYPGQPSPVDPHENLGNGLVFWSYASLKLARAVIVVPFVEELLWRGFLLRAFADWNHYEQVPWYRFSWRAFIGTALLSTVQHPDNWIVSIGCWLLFNGLFYWKKSLLCVMVCHAVTNLALYLYVLQTSDWRFW